LRCAVFKGRNEKGQIKRLIAGKVALNGDSERKINFRLTQRFRLDSLKKFAQKWRNKFEDARFDRALDPKTARSGGIC
jgi:hypothetical protein